MNSQVLQRFELVAASYRRAFDDVQACLGRLDRGDVPDWAFAIDQMPIEQMMGLDPELAQLEIMRRRWRTALHSMAELIALEGGQGMPIADPPEKARASLDRPSLDDGDRVRLDRFISILDQARAGGVIYLNGTFQPVESTPVPAQRRQAPARKPGRGT